MRNHRRLFAATIALSSAGAVAAAQYEASTIELKAVADCRAGCNGSTAGCRQSTQKADFFASAGFHLVAGSHRVAAHWNAADSPGLLAEPQWRIEPFVSDGRLVRVTITPILDSCVGVSPHTQGVTFYEIHMLQQR